MSDEFIETASQSWFGRIGNSIKGIFFGIILLPISVVLLFWNEGRAVNTAKSLQEAASVVVSVDATSVLPANEKKLIHLRCRVPAVTIFCSKATLGAFKIPDQIIAMMDGGELLMPTVECLAQLPPKWKEKAKLNGQSVFLGADETAPAIGDTRVTFDALKPGTFSILAQQKADTLAPYPTKSGREIEHVESGQKSAELMLQHAKDENRLLTWGLRLGGFVMMLCGFTLILKPLSVFADVLPFLGGIVDFGTGLISGVLAFAGSLVVIAIAWLAVRPLLGGALLLTAAGAMVYGLVRVRQSRARVGEWGR